MSKRNKKETLSNIEKELEDNREVEELETEWSNQKRKIKRKRKRQRLRTLPSLVLLVVLNLRWIRRNGGTYIGTNVKRM
jgi:ribosome biogenesis protein Tsr3